MLADRQVKFLCFLILNQIQHGFLPDLQRISITIQTAYNGVVVISDPYSNGVLRSDATEPSVTGIVCGTGLAGCFGIRAVVPVDAFRSTIGNNAHHNIYHLICGFLGINFFGCRLFVNLFSGFILHRCDTVCTFVLSVVCKGAVCICHFCSGSAVGQTAQRSTQGIVIRR